MVPTGQHRQLKIRYDIHVIVPELWVVGPVPLTDNYLNQSSYATVQIVHAN